MILNIVTDYPDYLISVFEGSISCWKIRYRGQVGTHIHEFKVYSKEGDDVMFSLENLTEIAGSLNLNPWDLRIVEY